MGTDQGLLEGQLGEGQDDQRRDCCPWSGSKHEVRDTISYSLCRSSESVLTCVSGYMLFIMFAFLNGIMGLYDIMLVNVHYL